MIRDPPNSSEANSPTVDLRSPGYIPPISDAAPLAQSLDLLARLRPDLVISSAVPSGTAVYAPGEHWPDCVEQARTRLAAVA
jgi:hydroxyacylglutathione hydrolase